MVFSPLHSTHVCVRVFTAHCCVCWTHKVFDVLVKHMPRIPKLPEMVIIYHSLLVVKRSWNHTYGRNARVYAWMCMQTHTNWYICNYIVSVNVWVCLAVFSSVKYFQNQNVRSDVAAVVMRTIKKKKTESKTCILSEK